MLLGLRMMLRNGSLQVFRSGALCHFWKRLNECLFREIHVLQHVFEEFVEIFHVLLL